MHSSVSNTAEASCRGDWDCRFLELSDSGFFLPSLDEVDDEKSADFC
jgi:hypothetical protein